MKTILLAILVLVAAPLAHSKPSEAKLIAYLQSTDYNDVETALHELPDDYPHSSNAVILIRGILRSNATAGYTEFFAQAHGGPPQRRVEPTIIIRDSARALGEYHATLPPEELAIIYSLFQTRVENDAMDALKALRGLNNPECVPYVLPELDNFSAHVARDAIRTLAVHGDKSIIPRLEPLTHDSQDDVREDAKLAIKQLEAKS